MYRVLDNQNKYVNEFPTWALANHFRHLSGRPDWKIVKTPNCFRESTDRQRSAVRFCRDTLNIPFNGDITNFQSCNDFLSQYLDLAKATAAQPKVIESEEDIPDWMWRELMADYDSAMG